MNDIINPQTDGSEQPSQDQQYQPAMAQPQPSTDMVAGSMAKHGKFSGKKLGLFLALFIVLAGGAVTYVLMNKQIAPKAAGYFYWANERYDETYWDGKIHTNTKDCLESYHVCHSNGSLVFLNGLKKAWKSDPKKNSTTKKLSSPTWDGPYTWSPGYEYGYDYIITGRQRVCFTLKDVSAKGNASIAIVVRNAKYTSTWPGGPSNKAQTIYTIQGTLSKNYKKGFKNLCAEYYNPSTAYKQTYRLYVKAGQVEIDKVNRMYEYSWFSSPYNPYQYGGTAAFKALVQEKQSGVKTDEPTKTNYTCSAQLRKTTEDCISETDSSVNNVSQQLTDTKVIKADDIEE